MTYHKNYITREQLHPELQEELDHLRKLHDYDYAKKNILDSLEKEYNEIVCTDIWYEAAKEYLSGRINTSELDNLIFQFKYNKNLFFDDNQLGFVYATDYQTSFVGGGGTFEQDVEFNIRDGADSVKRISIKELHNTKPNVELDDTFKMFCINYKRIYEK